MKLTTNFWLQEFIYPTLFEDEGEKCIRYLDERIVKAAQIIRTKVGVSVKINDWHSGGNFKLSGLRPFDTTLGASRSQHKFGRAADLKIQGMNGDEMRDVVRRYWSDLKGLITTIEDDTDTWLHIDCRWQLNQEVLNTVPNPNKAKERGGIEMPVVEVVSDEELQFYGGWD
jgi:hypothetical protein